MQKGYKRSNKGMAVLHFFIGLLFIALLVCAGYFVLTKLDYSDKLANPDASMRPYVEMTAQPAQLQQPASDDPENEPEGEPAMNALLPDATDEIEDFVDVSFTPTPSPSPTPTPSPTAEPTPIPTPTPEPTPTPTPTPKPTKIPTDRCASARKKGFNVPDPTTNATLKLTNFYVSAPNKNRVLQLNGYAYIDEADYDCEDSQVYLIVTQQETGEQVAYKTTMKKGVSGADLSSAACKNSSESEFRVFVNVKSYKDGDYSLGVVLYYQLESGTAYSYHELPESFTIVDGAIAAEDEASTFGSEE